MLIVEKISEMAEAARRLREAGKGVGFVPTMGSLHEGHLSLVRASKADSGATVLSIFVNPTQFGPSEDLARYPRDAEGDIEKCRREGVDVVFMPSAKEMYPEGFGTYVELPGVSDVFEGRSRPGHFRGVATVVLKLFNIVGPDRAYFGRKDFQQAVVIKKMVQDLGLGVEVVVRPTVREPDGLAMSSRNAYLAGQDREAAAAVYRALLAAEALCRSGERDAGRLTGRAAKVLGGEPSVRLEYAALVSPETLTPVDTAENGSVMLVAARIGTTRLIDNITLQF